MLLNAAARCGASEVLVAVGHQLAHELANPSPSPGRKLIPQPNRWIRLINCCAAPDINHGNPIDRFACSLLGLITPASDLRA